MAIQVRAIEDTATYIVIKHEEALLGHAVAIGDSVDIKVRRWSRLIPSSDVKCQLGNKVLGPELGSVADHMLVELLH